MSSDDSRHSLLGRRSAGPRELVRDSAVSRVADALRDPVIEGELLPGAELSQERVQDALGVSRSTLREALQVLVRERLLVHELSRGVFVRRLSLAGRGRPLRRTPGGGVRRAALGDGR